MGCIAWRAVARARVARGRKFYIQLLAERCEGGIVEAGLRGRRRQDAVVDCARLHARRLFGAARLDACAQLVQRCDGRVPVDARVGDRLAEHEIGRAAWRHVLAALDEVALKHDTDEAPRVIVANAELLRNVLRDAHLIFMLFLAVAVAAVDHDARRQLRLGEGFARLRDVRRAKVGARVGATQDHMALVVAGGFDDRREALLRDREESVRARRRLDRVDGDADGAVGAVLEADRHAQAACELAVHLRLGRACTDRAPRDEVCRVLRADRVEEFGGRWQADLGDLEEEATREAQALVDLVAAIQVWVVDKALPADGRTVCVSKWWQRRRTEAFQSRRA